MPFDEDSPYVVGAVDMYEIKAEAFRLCTGLMAPGKDQATNGFGSDPDSRQIAWDLWMKVHSEVINAVIRSTIAILPPLA